VTLSQPHIIKLARSNWALLDQGGSAAPGPARARLRPCRGDPARAGPGDPQRSHMRWNGLAIARIHGQSRERGFRLSGHEGVAALREMIFYKGGQIALAITVTAKTR
jgi:hypothetical protein